MDFLLGGFARAQLGELDDGLVADFGRLLDLPDPLLEALILGKEGLATDDDLGDGLGEILQLVQRFHGITLGE